MDDLAVAVEQSYVVDVRCAAAVRVEYDVTRLRFAEVSADAVFSEFLILALSGSSCESLCVKSLDLRALVVYPVYISAAVERSRTCCAVYVSASLLRSRDLSYDRCRSLGESLCLRSELLRSFARYDLGLLAVYFLSFFVYIVGSYCVVVLFVRCEFLSCVGCLLSALDCLELREVLAVLVVSIYDVAVCTCDSVPCDLQADLSMTPSSEANAKDGTAIAVAIIITATNIVITFLLIIISKSPKPD